MTVIHAVEFCMSNTQWGKARISEAKFKNTSH